MSILKINLDIHVHVHVQMNTKDRQTVVIDVVLPTADPR